MSEQRSIWDPPATDEEVQQATVAAKAESLTAPRAGAAGETDPQASWDTAVAVAGRTGSQRRIVLEHFAQMAASGCTNTELEAALHLDRPSGSNRRGELEKAGLVQKVLDPTGRAVTRPTSTGQPATVYRITTLGAQVAEYLLTDDPVYRHAYLQSATRLPIGMRAH